jgi:hypothetical protein
MSLMMFSDYLLNIIMEAFRSVVTQARQVLKTSDSAKLCMGNVSVDMDSVVGSLTLAYYYNLRYKEAFVPVVNCSRAFFPMKLDINMHLEEHKIPSLIFFEDDIKDYENI